MGRIWRPSSFFLQLVYVPVQQQQQPSLIVPRMKYSFVGFPVQFACCTSE